MDLDEEIKELQVTYGFLKNTSCDGIDAVDADEFVRVKRTVFRGLIDAMDGDTDSAASVLELLIRGPHSNFFAEGGSGETKVAQLSADIKIVTAYLTDQSAVSVEDVDAYLSEII